MDKEKILQAGKIAKEVRDWIKPQIKKDLPLLEIAEKIEDKILELGGKPAFPTNLSINEIAAHYTPSYNDENKAYGLLKIDFGVHVDGWISDNAFSVDLEDSEENKKLIEASQEALNNALKKIELGSTTSEVGETISNAITSKGFHPIINLSGHQIEEYDLHAGLTIPNYDDKREIEITSGLYAIEPFATNGVGKVNDGQNSGIYSLIDERNVRSPIAREVLEFIIEEYKTLPFCSRWIAKKFGTKALFGLRQLEQNGNLHQYPQLIEAGKGIVSQAEHTIFIDENGEKIVTTD